MSRLARWWDSVWNLDRALRLMYGAIKELHDRIQVIEDALGATAAVEVVEVDQLRTLLVPPGFSPEIAWQNELEGFKLDEASRREAVPVQILVRGRKLVRVF